MPTTIDGQSVSEVTIDGQQVTEITVDGDVVFTSGSTAPNGVISQYDAQALSGFNDGDTVSTWPDQVGTSDATGSATYQSSGINGFASLDFNGSSDSFDADIGEIAQKYVIYVVLEADFTDSTNNNYGFVSDGTGTGDVLAQWFNGTGWNVFAGDGFNGSFDATPKLFTLVFDGSSSLIREDGTQTGSSSGGDTNSLSDLGIGYARYNSFRYWDGSIGFVEVHDGTPSNGLQTREQEIANNWNITI